MRDKRADKGKGMGGNRFDRAPWSKDFRRKTPYIATHIRISEPKPNPNAVASDLPRKASAHNPVGRGDVHTHLP